MPTVGFQPGQRTNPAFGSPPIAPTNNNISFGSPGSFSAAVQTQGGDYDRIMKAYEDLLKSSGPGGSNRVNYTPISPTTTQYQPSSDVTSAMSNLAGLSNTGGYSAADIANIRARGISPIRSIYANAQQNLNRQRSLQGGYSPNYTAASSKMARELSDIIGQKSTDIEAGIAQNVAQNKLSIAPSYASFAGNEEAARNANEQANADRTNRANEFNRQSELQYGNFNNQNILGSIEGMRSLYGTTPALTSMFGNQVAQSAQLGQNQQQINNQRRRDSFGVAMPVFG